MKRGNSFLFSVLISISISCVLWNGCEGRRIRIEPNQEEAKDEVTQSPFGGPGLITLAFAGEEEGTGMAVSWSTIASTATSTVQYGVSSSNLDQISSGTSSSYYETYIHHVVLTELVPQTTYYYRVGDEQGGWSSIYSFTTAPGAFLPFVAAFYGDLGLINGNETRAALNTTLNAVDWHYHVRISYLRPLGFRLHELSSLPSYWFSCHSALSSGW
jgi:hypothetical protein